MTRLLSGHPVREQDYRPKAGLDRDRLEQALKSGAVLSATAAAALGTSALYGAAADAPVELILLRLRVWRLVDAHAVYDFHDHRDFLSRFRTSPLHRMNFFEKKFFGKTGFTCASTRRKSTSGTAT